MKIILVLLTVLFPLLAFAQTENTIPKTGLYAFETSAGMKVGAAFGELSGGDVDDELLSVTSSVSPRIEIHEMKDVNGIMQMRQVASMPIKKNTENKLGPMGYHLMLMDLNAPLQKGTNIPVTLVFKNAGEKKMNIPVLARQAK